MAVNIRTHEKERKHVMLKEKQPQRPRENEIPYICRVSFNASHFHCGTAGEASLCRSASSPPSEALDDPKEREMTAFFPQEWITSCEIPLSYPLFADGAAQWKHFSSPTLRQWDQQVVNDSSRILPSMAQVSSYSSTFTCRSNPLKFMPLRTRASPTFHRTAFLAFPRTLILI